MFPGYSCVSIPFFFSFPHRISIISLPPVPSIPVPSKEREPRGPSISSILGCSRRLDSRPAPGLREDHGFRSPGVRVSASCVGAQRVYSSQLLLRLGPPGFLERLERFPPTSPKPGALALFCWPARHATAGVGKGTWEQLCVCALV